MAYRPDDNVFARHDGLSAFDPADLPHRSGPQDGRQSLAETFRCREPVPRHVLKYVGLGDVEALRADALKKTEHPEPFRGVVHRMSPPAVGLPPSIEANGRKESRHDT